MTSWSRAMACSCSTPWRTPPSRSMSSAVRVASCAWTSTMTTPTSWQWASMTATWPSTTWRRQPPSPATRVALTQESTRIRCGRWGCSSFPLTGLLIGLSSGTAGKKCCMGRDVGLIHVLVIDTYFKLILKYAGKQRNCKNSWSSTEIKCEQNFV